jgi:putative transposase
MQFSSSVIEHTLYLSECGRTVSEICKITGVSDTTFYNWKEKFNGLNAAGIDLYLHMEKENRELNRKIGLLLLDKAALQCVINKNLDKNEKKQQIEYLLTKQPITKQRAQCLLLLK